jgi:hypothetical protein
VKEATWKEVLRKPVAIQHAVSYAIILALVGTAIAVPLSYWFRPGFLRMMISLPSYIGEALKYFTGTASRFSYKNPDAQDTMDLAGGRMFVTGVVGAMI